MNTSATSEKSRLATLLFCIFLGGLGIHRFYTGRTLLGLLFLFTFGLLGLGVLIDFILILCGNIKDDQKLPVANWRTDGDGTALILSIVGGVVVVIAVPVFFVLMIAGITFLGQEANKQFEQSDSIRNMGAIESTETGQSN